MKHLFFFFLLFIVSAPMVAQNSDIAILRDINVNRNKKLDNTFILFSQSITPVSIGIPLGVYTVGLIKHDSTLKNKGSYITASILTTAGISFALKYAVNRQRPYVTYPFIDNVMDPESASFPSGHTSDAFATATSVSLAFPKWYVIAPSFVWAGFVGYSRMHVGVHYPSDVLAGAIIGVGTSYLCYKANIWLHKRKYLN